MENKTKDPNKVKQGKRNKASGRQFEAKVRKHLESLGWTVSKWQNNVKDNKLVPARPGPFKLTTTGFPDFICFAKLTNNNNDFFEIRNKQNETDYLKYVYDIKLVECKSNGKLSKEEQLKCKWLMDNLNIDIFIASKSKVKRGQIDFRQCHT